MMRFKVDENLPAEVALLLSEKGHDAQTVHDGGIAGASDETLHAAYEQEKRILVTLDIDFSDIRTYPPEQLSGTIVLRVGNQSKRHILMSSTASCH